MVTGNRPGHLISSLEERRGEEGGRYIGSKRLGEDLVVALVVVEVLAGEGSRGAPPLGVPGSRLLIGYRDRTHQSCPNSGSSSRVGVTPRAARYRAKGARVASFFVGHSPQYCVYCDFGPFFLLARVRSVFFRVLQTLPFHGR